MVEWKPISLEALGKRIAQGVARMSPPQRRLWEAIRIEPEKWQLPPYAEAGGRARGDAPDLATSIEKGLDLLRLRKKPKVVP